MAIIYTEQDVVSELNSLLQSYYDIPNEKSKNEVLQKIAMALPQLKTINESMNSREMEELLIKLELIAYN